MADSTSRAIAVAAMVVTLLVTEATTLRGDSTHLPLLDTRVATELRKCQELFEEGSTAEAIDRLHELLGDTLAKRSVVTISGDPGIRRHRSSTVVVSDFLRSLSRDVITMARERVAVTAEAHFRRALERRDPRALLRCAESFPLAEIAPQAAIIAGDIFLERGNLMAARWALNTIPWQSADLPVRDAVVRRQLLRSRLQGDGVSYQRWLERVPVEMTPEIDSDRGFVPSRGKAPPRLPLTNRIAVRVWPRNRSQEIVLRSNSLGHEALYTPVPTILDGEVFVPTPGRLLQLSLGSGERRPGTALPNFPSYREPSFVLRHRVAAAGSTVATTFVDHARRQEGRGRRSGVVRAEVPHRSVGVFERGPDGELVPTWDTMASPDPVVSGLSFNSTPVIAADRIFALGWRESGFVDAMLVALDRASGQTLWTTLIASGQVDLTRFGELAEEPRLGEILLDGDTIYACTNLGVMAAVRPTDGRPEWITEYRPVRPLLDISTRRRISYPYQSLVWWESCSLVPLEDRIVVTPQDTWFAFAFDRENGSIVDRRRVERYPNFLLGRRHLSGKEGDELVFCSGHKVERVPARSLASDGEVSWLDGSVQARPALTRDGVIYTTETGLKCLTFDGVPVRQTLARFTSLLRRSRQGSAVRDGMVTVSGDRVLVTSSFRIECFRLVPVQ